MTRVPKQAEKGLYGDEPLAWGLSKPDGPLRHILSLSAEENGAACGCICPGCGSDLLAINTDKDETYLSRAGTKRRSFRHAVGAQRKRCLIQAARAAAVQLFLSQNRIQLPEHRKNAVPSLGDDGLVARIPSHWARVVDRRWIDTFRGVLLLDDGQEVLVCAQVDTRINALDGFDTVLQIECDDPAVASMSPEDVLARLRDPKGLCWIKHPGDDELQKRAEALAHEHLAGMSPDLIEGMSGPNASETLLHWLIKEAIRKAKTLRVPGVSERLKSKVYHGVHADLAIPPLVLEIFDAQLEKRSGQIVPDVRCKARIRGSVTGVFDLLIEAVVHNEVSPQKLEKIREMGLAALEIRSDLFRRFGSVSREVLERDICDDPANKAWLYHPLWAAEHAQAIQRLRAKEEESQRELDRVAAVEKWHTNASLDQLYGDALRQIAAGWSGKQAPPPHPGVTQRSILSEILSRRGVDLSSPWLSGKDGVLAAIKSVQDAALGRPEVTSLLRHLDRALVASSWEQTAGPYLLLAIDCWDPALMKSEQDALRELRAVVEGSYRMGQRRYCRSHQYDGLICVLFPDLLNFLASDWWTQEHAEDEHREALRVETEARRTLDAEAEAKYLEQVKRQEQERARDREERRLRSLQAAIDEAARTWTWGTPSSTTGNLDALLKTALRRVTAYGVDGQHVVRLAWHARAAGSTVAQALEELRLDDPLDINSVVLAWQQVNLLRRLVV